MTEHATSSTSRHLMYAFNPLLRTNGANGAEDVLGSCGGDPNPHFERPECTHFQPGYADEFEVTETNGIRWREKHKNMFGIESR